MTYYNRERMKEKMGWLSPVQYREQQARQLIGV
ncbi:IS3 family transposase [Salinicoccus siamensis]|uniref:IS3 family transposase n=1 Tax=Salinicoccus siamensis TaxID=381830 RepID=A0ABV5Z4I9_9STAP